MAALLNSLFFVFNISFLPKYRVIYYDYIVKWCSVSLDISEMLASRWMSGVTNLDRISNRRIGGIGLTKVGEISKKVQERRLKWYGHVLRREA